MSILEEQIKTTLLPGMSIPIELSKLFDWIEGNKFYTDRNRTRVGYLYPLEKIQEGWRDDKRPGGTFIEFFAEGNTNMRYWFGHEKPEVLNRICVFAKTGADGSMAAFWINDDGEQKIVHLGSGSGSTLVCILAETPVDFLRLLAIGYDEICWNEHFNQTLTESEESSRMKILPNLDYQNWVKETFDTSIPSKASEIVLNPSEMGDDVSNDAFYNWVERQR